MEWLKIAALVAQLADATYSCKHINAGTAVEVLSPLKTCKSLVIAKSSMVIPMFVIKNEKWNKTLTIAVLAGGSIGFTVSFVNLNKD